jgi:hypothetical protein
MNLSAYTCISCQTSYAFKLKTKLLSWIFEFFSLVQDKLINDAFSLLS